MKTYGQLTSFVFLLIMAGFQSELPSHSNPGLAGLTQADCDSAFERLRQDEDWLQQLVDPVLSTPEEVNERLATYAAVYQCIPADTDSPTLGAIRLLTEYFLDFAGGYQTPKDESDLYLFNPATTSDPAIIQLRQEIGIPSATGYLYVRLYTSREAMPDLVRPIFKNEKVRGVTIYTRYIAVLLEGGALASQTLPKTVSHELVHAYLNSTSGFAKFDKFPKWYAESMAVYFSGSSDPSCTVVAVDIQTTANTCETAPKEYEQYAANFKYLESKIGHEQFQSLIKQSYEEGNPAIVYEALGFATYETFAEKAYGWKKGQDLLVQLIIGGICGLPLIGYIIFYFWNMRTRTPEPEPEHIYYPPPPPPGAQG